MNLDHRRESPLGQFLTEGRKFGISLILATQTLSNLKREEQARLFLSSHKLFFRPSDVEVKQYAQVLENQAGEKSDYWIHQLTSLEKGECISIGPSRSEDGSATIRPFRIRIASLENRSLGG